MTRRPRNGEAGFTLLELVIALLVMSIGVAGLFGVLATAFKSTSIDIHRTDATVIAAHALAQLQVAADPVSGPLPGVTRNGQTYAVNAEVQLAAASNGDTNAYAELIVNVTWSDQGGTHTVTQSTSRYPTPPTSVATVCAAPTLAAAPIYNYPPSGDPSLDVSWVEPTGGTAVTQWQVQISPDGATWTTAIADEPPLPPNATHQVEIGGLAPGVAYVAQVVAESACAAPATFAATPAAGIPAATAGSSASTCTAGSFTLGPPTVTRSPTGPPPGILSQDVTVVVTSPVDCPGGFTITTVSTAGDVVQAQLGHGSAGPTSYVGTLPGGTEVWDLGPHLVALYAGPVASGPVIGTAVLCVEQQGASTC